MKNQSLRVGRFGLSAGMVLSVFLATFPGQAQVASCPALSLRQKNLVKLEWETLLQKYGWPAGKMHPPRVCVSAEKFHEIPQGAAMRSVYDRSADTVYLRHWGVPGLRHELAHGWLERKFPGLPYIASENLVLCMTDARLVAAQPVDTKRIHQSLLRPPAGYCQDAPAAAAALQLSFDDLQTLLQGD